MNIADPFERFSYEALCEVSKNLGGKLSPSTWMEEMRRLHDRWHAYHGPKKKVRAPVEPSDEAAKLYELYPVKKDKLTALRAIGKALEKVPYERLERAVIAYAQTTGRWPEKELQYRQHPATWFNAGAYDDDPKSWERPGMTPPRTTTVLPTAPHGWVAFMLRESPHWVRLHQEGGVPAWERLQADERQTILELMAKG